MQLRKIFQLTFLLVFCAASLNSAPVVQAARSNEAAPEVLAQDSGVTAYDLIVAMNTLRASYGYAALIEDPVIDAVAQSTAEIMAANQMSWHIGDVSGRVTSAGYGGGGKVFATENFAAGNNYSIDEIMIVWGDESHMLPATNGAYCNVGAGIAKSPNGLTYYVLQAAYVSGKSCGKYTSSGGATTTQGGTTDQGRVPGVSQVIVPVKIAAPDADGNIYHVVEAGQSFWAIAVAYKVTIKDIETWNNLTKDSKLQIGQKLFIPSANTKGYATPTPVGMFAVSTPDVDGKIVHTVASYQTLSTISDAYKVSIDTILSLNGIRVDTPLQIGQKLVIDRGHVTPSPTPRPLTPIEKLTPEADGQYYHVIQSGQTLSWIADLYGIKVNDLMAWNNLNASSILHPNQKLLLKVTPPATATFTPGPATATFTPTQAPPTLTATQPSTPTTAPSPTVIQTNKASAISMDSVVLYSIVGLAVIGLLLVLFFSRKK